MIKYKLGHILDENAEALVNTVNCVGVMGRGIALEFKKEYKDNFKKYAQACKRKEVKPGKMLVFETGISHNPRYIINFPTKRNWRAKSKIKDIKSGLDALVEQIKILNLRSIAIPALGCGLGGLEWEKVRPLIVQAVQDFSDVDISIFEPNDEQAREVASRSIPTMTPVRASLVSLMHSYLNGMLDPVVTLLEVHKLMYFMQCAGEKLNLNYTQMPWGPDADNLNLLIAPIDGNFINGYADGEDMLGRELTLVSEAIEEAQDVLKNKKSRTRDRCNRVKELIEGFETPFGLELLSKAHWIFAKEKARSESEILKKFDAWSQGERQFTKHEIMIAIEELRKKEWIRFSPKQSFNLGIAKAKQGNLPGAIIDYDEAIRRKPDLVGAWSNRGIAKAEQGNLPGAIADYDEAIKLKPDLAGVWNNRGIAKAEQGSLPGAIADYDKAIELKPDLAEAWNNRGIAKVKQGDLPGAISDYDEAIKLKPDLVAAWVSLAVVRDAVRAELKPEGIREIFDKAHSAINALLEAIKEDKKKDQFKYPIHYTNLDALRNLAKGGKFRLHSAKSMDDDEEGNALFDLFDEKYRAKIRDTFSTKSSEDLEVFLGSFVTASNIVYGDDLMWRTYGKHNGEERAGCALVFDKEQHFASQTLPLMSLLEARSEDFAEKKQEKIVPKEECCLYPVRYESTKKIQGEADNLCEALVQLCDEKYKETREIVAVLLNQIRYLFKSAIYQREEEYRLTIVRARKSPAVKGGASRTYIECPLDMKEVTVLLGPQAKKAEFGKQCLKGEDSFKEIKTTDKQFIRTGHRRSDQTADQ